MKAVATICADVQVEIDTFDASSESEVAQFFSRAGETLSGRIDVLVNIVSYVDVNDDPCTASRLYQMFERSYELNQKTVSFASQCLTSCFLLT
jgi:NAD(P)-dependent dehydrogenase (short-subunit alcohol dehydrogenase family)